MGSALSYCYESPDSNHPPPNNDTGRSDLYHASWDPSEAGKYHTDSTRKADDDYNLEADDEAALNQSENGDINSNSREQIHSGATPSTSTSK